MKKSEFLTFNDGIVELFKVVNTANQGDSINETLSPLCVARFDARTVGIKRQYEAMQYQIEIKSVLQIPMNRNITTKDIAVVNGLKYRIVQVQHIKDTKPPHTLISLADLEVSYDDNGI